MHENRPTLITSSISGLIAKRQTWQNCSSATALAPAILGRCTSPCECCLCHMVHSYAIYVLAMLADCKNC